MKALSQSEFREILGLLPPHLIDGRRIKYVYSSFDNRDGMIFTVTFRHWFASETVFTVVNRSIGPTPKHNNLRDEIVEWLNTAKFRKEATHED